MRTLAQPGPVHPERIDSFATTLHHIRYELEPGRTLNDALAGPLVAAGFRSATLRFTAGALSPFRYVMPGPPDGASHAAYFSAPRAPDGEVRIEQANASFGFAEDGSPLIHCHAAWVEADGGVRGGHILPKESVVARAGTVVEAWGSRDVTLAVGADAETNFALLQPSGGSGTGAGAAVVARVKPNEDILGVLETLATRHELGDAVVRGSLGSLVGACFTHGNEVPDDATEVLVTEGWVRDGTAALGLLVVDMRGHVHRGMLERGRNAVCITFDLVLEAS